MSSNASNFKFGDEFMCVPKLSSDGSNFHIWRDKLILALRVQGLDAYLDNKATKPGDPAVRPPDEQATATPNEVSAMEAYQKAVSDWTWKEAIVLQQIVSTIPDALYLKIKGKIVLEAWKVLKDNFEKRSHMFTIDLRRQLQDVRCEDNGNVRTHFDNLCNMHEELTALSESIPDRDFAAIILSSLPKSYDTYLSTITATLSVLGKEVDPDALILSVIDEYNCCSIKNHQTKDKGKSDAAFFASGSLKGGKGGKGGKSDVKCFNCHKKGHKKADCWAKGGGKEGQGPRSKGKKDDGKDSKGRGAVAAAVEAEDGVWMAEVEDSDNEFGSWEGSDGDEWLMKEVETDWNVLYGVDGNLSASSIASYALYLYHDLPDLHYTPVNDDDDLPDLQYLPTDYNDSSYDGDIEDVALQAMSDLDSDSEVDIDPYWLQIKVDELYGLGRPTVINNLMSKGAHSSLPSLISCSDSSNDSMPSLMTVSDSSDGNNNIAIESADYELEYVNLSVDKGKDGLSTYACATLVNVEGEEGIETELYNSGASHHMSPYCEQMENYIPIAPKSITAAVKWYFQAISKGDLRIQVPNIDGNSTLILLKDVLHCPDVNWSMSKVLRGEKAQLIIGQVNQTY